MNDSIISSPTKNDLLIDTINQNTSLPNSDSDIDIFSINASIMSPVKIVGQKFLRVKNKKTKKKEYIDITDPTFLERKYFMLMEKFNYINMDKLINYVGHKGRYQQNMVI